jgi:hypothetical protein
MKNCHVFFVELRFFEDLARGIHRRERSEPAADKQRYAKAVCDVIDDSGDRILLNPDFDVRRLCRPQIAPLRVSHARESIGDAVKHRSLDMPTS